ncbi:hypothetical protein BW730_11430 [Tessaracoccus aquimaris]|uniref:alpha-L-rhamnosidase n=1 Tax=Tessaracoccus aquimaris TaxID=1332264 RepID=A0A1Q2CTB8_9ACTN|nr:alpha-L-rhamnosidase [Tessaracoccus aquimaris]AQP49346.1 hypothetical protein BW730_11430 [Tessaracoccus aquimaris]
MATISTLTAELRGDTEFVATTRPRLSWQVTDAEPGWLQAWAEIRLGDDVVRVEGRESNLVAWPFAPLEPGRVAGIRVRAVGISGEATEFSDELRLRLGAVSEDAPWGSLIGLPQPQRPAQPFLLRAEFEATRVARATLHWTALGVAEVSLNGVRIDDAVLAPGWPTYHHRLLHETTDVTDLVVEGANCVAAVVAGCWFTESYGFHGQGAPVFGSQPAFAMRLEVSYADGSTDEVLSDGGWRVTGDGPLVASGLYAGESYDARLAVPGWDRPGFDDGAWPRAEVIGALDGVQWPRPDPQTGPPVRRIQEVPVASVLRSPSGSLLLDFGQNLVGRLRITVDGPSGQVVTLRHAEVLENGELGTRPLRVAEATDRYTLAGGAPETWEPAFTFHGFRYAQIDGWPGEFDPAAVVAVVLHNDLNRTGEFTTSHQQVARLHDNVVWSMRGNFLAIPTDCPQRDERLGWTGDIGVFAPTAAGLYDVRGFLANWLRDLAADQLADGTNIPLVIPDVLKGAGPFGRPTAAWGDAATIVPWTLYRRYGDLGVLAEAYPSMVQWCETILRESQGTGLWQGRMQLGDWLDPTAPPENPAAAKTSGDVVASAYLAHSLDLTARTARLLGQDEDAERFAAEAATSRAAFRAAYVTEGGRMMSDAQTAYALALGFDLVKEPGEDRLAELRARLARRLAELVREGGYHIATGFVGTPLVIDVLSATGYLEEAERLLLQTRCPSWLYPVTMGATTIWERWDSMLPDGTINPGEMTSFNHYALGAVADWLHRVVAGLDVLEPGYSRLRIAPRPLRRMGDARYRLDTPYGLAEVGWRRGADGVTVEALVPANTTALVELPGVEPGEVGSGRHTWTIPEDRRPVATRRPLTIESPAADIIDDEEALAAVLAVLRERDPERAATLTRQVLWGERRPFSLAFLFAPPELLRAVDAALAGLPGTREP